MELEPKKQSAEKHEDGRQRCVSPADLPPVVWQEGTTSGSVDGIQVVVLEDAPNVVEVWSRKFVYEEDPGAVLTMQVVDGQVVEKCISMKNKWRPETIANEVKTQGEISSKHLVLPTFTVEVIYFGNVEISETLT
jgi:hypothetical protein